MAKRFEIKIGEFEEENIVDNQKKMTIREISDMCTQMNNLYEENERLKQQEKRLYNYFRKCFNNVSEQGFQETWEVVKKYD